MPPIRSRFADPALGRAARYSAQRAAWQRHQRRAASDRLAERAGGQRLMGRRGALLVVHGLLMLGLALSLLWLPQAANAAGRVADAPAQSLWRIAAAPNWVQPVAVPVPTDARQWSLPGAGGRRQLLVDVQQRHGFGAPQVYQRVRAVATHAEALGQVSQVQLPINPAWQRLTLHHAWVWRDGQAADRLATARIELMRRERGLEQQVIDGLQTLLVVLSDVRVGEAVEIAFTLEGDNPLFEGHIAGGFQLGMEVPVDVLNARLLTPVDRSVRVQAIASTEHMARTESAGVAVWSLLRQRVPAVIDEAGTPPWFKVYPALQFSDYRSWDEVQGWAARLLAPAPLADSVREQATRLRASGLQGEALAAAALAFVQDEVRYFSASLGASSHRPKPAERTLAERLGDCKDKVVLLNALLTELGFEARPALVSLRRNRGLSQFLPTHEEFDHVVTQLKLDGRLWYLDATMSGQGETLALRGHLPYGQALVVGEPELQTVALPVEARNDLSFVQRWDYSQPGLPARLQASASAQGLAAEGLRRNLATGGLQRMAEGLASQYTRIWPDLRMVGEPRVDDDRRNNRLALHLSFESSETGRYDQGAFELEPAAIEMADLLSGPAEALRRLPFGLDQPMRVHSRIEMLGAVPLTAVAPPPFEVLNPHFRLRSALRYQGSTAVFEREFERLRDEVLPQDLPLMRRQLSEARNALAGRVRLPLVDLDRLKPQLQAMDRALRQRSGQRNDTLHRLMVRQSVNRLLATDALSRIRAGSMLAAQVLADRAQSANMLGDFGDGLRDADAALRIAPGLVSALDARGVAQVGLGQLDGAIASFQRLAQQQAGSGALQWMATLQLQQGLAREAEAQLQQALPRAAGESRAYGLLWLYLAAEAHGQGRQAIADHVDDTDGGTLAGALLRHFAGRLDRAGVMRLASATPDMERLNLAEAWFYLGQQHLVRGEPLQAEQALQQVLKTDAVPYREHVLARLALQRLAQGGAQVSRAP